MGALQGAKTGGCRPPLRSGFEADTDLVADAGIEMPRRRPAAPGDLEVLERVEDRERLTLLHRGVRLLRRLELERVELDAADGAADRHQERLADVRDQVSER